MLHALHHAGHRYLKLLFVLALAGSSALFFIGAALPKPPALLVVLVGAALGIAVEWAYFTVSCDLTESISERDGWGIARNLIYTLVGGAASWFLFTNAALTVGWAPHDEVIGLDRVTWAKIMALLIVAIVFILSARRQRVKDETDLQAIARSVSIMLPHAPAATRLHLLSVIASEAAKYETVIEGSSEKSVVVSKRPEALPTPKPEAHPTFKATDHAPEAQPMNGTARPFRLDPRKNSEH